MKTVTRVGHESKKNVSQEYLRKLMVNFKHLIEAGDVYNVMQKAFQQC